MGRTGADQVKRAESLFRAGRLTEAREAYEDARRQRPDDRAVLKRLGDLALYENRAEDAVEYLGRALECGSRRWPLAAAIRAQKALAHYRMDQFPEASREFAAAAGPWAVGPLRDLDALARQLAVFGDELPYRIDGPGLTRLEFVITEPLPTVELVVNGRPPALFFVDTGGAELILDKRFAAEVGAGTSGAFKAEFSGGKRASTGLGRIDSVQAGELRVSDVPIHTIDMRSIAEYFGLDVKGILGTRFLMHFLPTIDYPRGALILRRRAPAPGEEPPGVTADRQPRIIRFWLAGLHVILARGRLNDLPSTFFWVDTGLASGGFLASVAKLRAAGVSVDWSRAKQAPGGGGMAKEVDVQIDTLALGEGEQAITRQAVPGIAQKKPPSTIGSRLGFQVGGLISHAFFTPYALTIDFTNMCLVLERP